MLSLILKRGYCLAARITSSWWEELIWKFSKEGISKVEEGLKANKRIQHRRIIYISIEEE